MSDNKERILIYIIIGFIAIALLVVLVIIWKPASSTGIEQNLNVVQVTEDYDKVQEESYTDFLKRVLLTYNYEELYKYVSQDWLKQVEMDHDSLKDWLINEGIIGREVPNITEVTPVVTNEVSVYRFKVIPAETSFAKYVIINEKTPGSFDVSFEQQAISSLANQEYKETTESGEYKCTVKAVLNNVLQLDVEVKNTTDAEVYFDLASGNDVKLCLNDGTTVNATDISCALGDEVLLNPGSSFKVRLTFFISLEKQNMIDKVKFTYVRSNNTMVDAYVTLKEGDM